MRYVIISFTLVTGILFQINTAQAYTRTPSGQVYSLNYTFNFSFSDLCTSDGSTDWSVYWNLWPNNYAIGSLHEDPGNPGHLVSNTISIDQTFLEPLPQYNRAIWIEGLNGCTSTIEGDGIGINFTLGNEPTPASPFASTTNAITNLFSIFYRQATANIYFIFGSLFVVGLLLWTLREIERYLK